MPALLIAASRRLAAALQLLPAVWGATVLLLLLLPGGVEVGAAVACSPAVLHSAEKISFSSYPPYFPTPGAPHFYHSFLLFRQRDGDSL